MRNIKNQQGFTIVELMAVIIFVAAIVLAVTLLVVAFHFIGKFW